jgi:hypothetical protein
MDSKMIKKPDPADPTGVSQPLPLKRGQSAQALRDKRSKEALKANMARRKAQVKVRKTEASDQGGPEHE